MAGSIQVAGLEISVVRKDIRNLHLSVLPPDGRVRIAAPDWMDTEAIRLFAIDKLGWIKRQQGKMRAQEREPARDYIERESHQVWGQRYLLHIIEHDAPPDIEIRHKKLVMRVRRGATQARREEILYDWYRSQIRDALPSLLEQWTPLVGARPRRIHIQRMKTKWGSCNPDNGSIRLNSELAKKPPEALEYIFVHELVHLQEPTHGPKFIQTMDRLMPQWRDRRDALNLLPVRDEWGA